MEIPMIRYVHFENGLAKYNNRGIVPDVKIAITIKDLVQKKDPTLEYALKN